MSMEDLREHGVLLPEEEWGEHRLETTVPQGRLATGFVIAVVGLLSIYLGAGGLWTWIGLIVFLVALYWIIWVCDRAVAAQRERFRHEREDWAEARE